MLGIIFFKCYFKIFMLAEKRAFLHLNRLIFNFLKKGRGSSNFRKIRAFILKLHTNILYRSRNFGIEFGF